MVRFPYSELRLPPRELSFAPKEDEGSIECMPFRIRSGNGRMESNVKKVRAILNSARPYRWIFTVWGF